MNVQTNFSPGPPPAASCGSTGTASPASSEHGFAVLEKLLRREECVAIASLYPDDSRFRSRIVMDWHGFGKGEYQYFAYPLPPLDLIFGQKRVSGSPNGAPATMTSMLDFAARHKIAPQVEHFPMSRANDALHHLESGKARYRIVLDPDFA